MIVLQFPWICNPRYKNDLTYIQGILNPQPKRLGRLLTADYKSAGTLKH